MMGVYILRAPDTGEVVYVGRSRNIRQRLEAHRAKRSWWRDDFEVEVIPSDFFGIYELESRTIERLSPSENIVRNGERSWRYTKAIGSELREARRRAGFTQGDVARAVGVSESIVCSVETGRGATRRYADPVVQFIKGLEAEALEHANERNQR